MTARMAWMYGTDGSLGKRVAQLMVVGLLGGLGSAAKAAVLCVKTSLTSSIELRSAWLSDERRIGSLSSSLLQFRGLNVQIVDGTGDTGGTLNGRGNLIIGYNEDSDPPNVRTGSHNLVIGHNHSYSSYGGLVAGAWNTISADAASVCGGRNNVASGAWAAVSGGNDNEASGNYSSVSGGRNRDALNQDDWRTGGLFQDF